MFQQEPLQTLPATAFLQAYVVQQAGVASHATPECRRKAQSSGTAVRCEQVQHARRGGVPFTSRKQMQTLDRRVLDIDMPQDFHRLSQTEGRDKDEAFSIHVPSLK